MSDIEECDVCHGEGEIHDADFSDGDSDQQMWIMQDTLRPCPKCSRIMTSEPTAESPVGQVGDKPEMRICGICDETYNVHGERAAIHDHPEAQRGPEREAWLKSGLKWETWCSARQQKDEPTYTMQQAIDKIVGGLVLEWRDDTNDSTAVAMFGVVYEVKTNGRRIEWWCRGCGYNYCGTKATAKSQCLDDYKSRFRAEIEKKRR